MRFERSYTWGSVHDALAQRQPLFWINVTRRSDPAAVDSLHISNGIDDAARRLKRFAPLLGCLFQELASSEGVIDSPLMKAEAIGPALGLDPGCGRLLVKADHDLPVAGSIKARGGIHAVLAFAEGLARTTGLLDGGDPRVLGTEQARAVFGQYRVSVGSTGNLGVSVGTMSAALGFETTVHMASNAKAWKRDRLRAQGVRVVEHKGDYAHALAAARESAAGDPHSHFIDDEDSRPLLFGYATAAAHLRRQLEQADVPIDVAHPLFVYLPCGVGGAPAGIAVGLHREFGAAVHCVFAEPTECPCVLLQMLAGDGEHPSVYDAGLTGRTEADGLAVPRASLLAVALARPIVSGIITVPDERMFHHLHLAHRELSIRLEPSAAAGFSGPQMLIASPEGRRYVAAHGLRLSDATHVIWTTGGRFVPDAEFAGFVARGAAAQTV